MDSCMSRNSYLVIQIVREKRMQLLSVVEYNNNKRRIIFLIA